MATKNKRERALDQAYEDAFESWTTLKQVMDALLNLRSKESERICPRCHRSISTYNMSFNCHRGKKSDGRSCAMSYKDVPKGAK